MMALQVGYFFRILFCVYGVPLHPNFWVAPDLRSKYGKIKYVASIGSLSLDCLLFSTQQHLSAPNTSTITRPSTAFPNDVYTFASPNGRGVRVCACRCARKNSCSTQAQFLLRAGYLSQKCLLWLLRSQLWSDWRTNLKVTNSSDRSSIS